MGDFGHTSPFDTLPSGTYLAPGELRMALATSQSPIDSLKCRKCRTMTAEHQFQTASGLNQSRRQVHQFLDHGFDPAPLGGMAYRCFFAHKPKLTNRAQEVVGQSAKSQYQRVRCELARRKPLHVHGGFDLAVELLAR